MSDDMDMMKCAVREVLDERSKIPPELHTTHHDWIKLQIEKQQARTEFWQQMLAKSLPAMIGSLCLAAAGWLWHYVTTHVVWR